MPRISKSKRPAYREKVANRTSKAAQDIHRTYRWKKLSRQTRATAWCPVCELEGVIHPAEDLDHAIRLQDSGHPWDKRNHLPLCKRDHGIKTKMETQGYRPERKSVGSGLYVAADLVQITYDILAYKNDAAN